MNSEVPYLKCAKILLGLSLACIFFQINAVIAQGGAWGGFFNPYTSLQLYISDIFFFATLLFYTLHVFFHSKQIFIAFSNNSAKCVLFGAFFFICLSYFFSVNQTTTFIWIIQALKLLLIYFLVVNKLLSEKSVFLIIIGALCVQSVLALLQFAFQHSLNLTFLGETVFNSNTLNVGKITLFGGTFVRGYGTFTHSNVLGGSLGIGLLMVWYLYAQEQLKRAGALRVALVLAGGLLISFSRSAWLALAVMVSLLLALRVYKISYERIGKFLISSMGGVFVLGALGVAPLIAGRLLNAGGEADMQRLTQIKTAFSIMLNNPLGVGMGNYTNVAHLYAQGKTMPWEFQPVHNVYLLAGAELGIVAMLLLLALTGYVMIKLLRALREVQGKSKAYPIYVGIIAASMLFVLANFDHYLYTAYSAQALLMVLLATLTNILRTVGEASLDMET